MKPRILLALTAALQIILLPEAKLSLKGDSTLHPFSSTATEFSMTVLSTAAANGAPLAELVAKGQLSGLEVSIPVKALKSGESGLDRNLLKAIKAEQFQEIHFRLSGYAAEGADKVKASGMLSIAGKEQAVELEAETETVEKGLRIKGSKDLLMSEYGIKPPSLMMGMIKVKDWVIISYDFILGIKKEAL